MITNAGIRTYRPRQIVTMQQDSRRVKSGISLRLSFPVWRFLAIAFFAMLVIGLLTTQYFYGRMMEMRAQAEKLQTTNARVYDQYVNLSAERAKLTSRQQVAALANTKLQLFEPSPKQVRRM